MKLILPFLIIIFLNNCSFDNKSGIWQNEKTISKKDNKFREFKTLRSINDSYNETVVFNKNFDLKVDDKINNLFWRDIYFNDGNNFKNFNFSNYNKKTFLGKKISRYEINKNFLYEEDYVITSDVKGNVIIFSIKENKILKKFNFYKKKYKKIQKNLNFILEKKILYITDNIGFIYAFDIKNENILWAKNYKIPFRSNIKIYKEMIITSTQNNNLLFFNKKTGAILRLIPTEETVVKNQFINNLAIDANFSFYLNTYGSLYAVDNSNMKITWFLNLNKSLDLNASNLFLGNQVVINDNKLFVSTNNFLYVINKNDGRIIYKKNIILASKPLVSNNYILSITKNNFLILMNADDGKIIYSYEIAKKIADYLESKKKKIDFKNIFFANDRILIFLKNSYILSIRINGEIEKISKLSSKIYSNPIFVKGSLIFFDKKNRLVISN